MTEIAFSVAGRPATAGSKRAFPFKGKDGRLHVAVSDSSGEKGKSWRALLVDAARAVYGGPPLDGPLVLDVRFRFERPKAHFRTVKKSPDPIVRPNAPDFPAVKPDATKLLRALEDALTGVIWTDDARIVVQRVRKVYSLSPGVDVTVSAAVRAPSVVIAPAETTSSLADDTQRALFTPELAAGRIRSTIVAPELVCTCSICVEERGRGARP